MFDYIESTKREVDSRNGRITTRTITILDGGKTVGYIQQSFHEDGSPVIDFYSDKPVSYGTVERESRHYSRLTKIGTALSVVDAKRKFSAWYADHARPAPAAELPASPDAEFFPTPGKLAGKMVSLVDWRKVETALEPSAGKGDLIECAAKCAYHRSRYDDRSLSDRFDVIERDRNLQHILRDKGFRLISDDFLTFRTSKRYDVILMNPPFSNGDEHLLKAISLQTESGGQIVCLLNAETIRNPFTNRRKALAAQLAKYEARIEFVAGAFAKAERKTDVEVAIVYMNIPRPRQNSNILDGLNKAQAAQAASDTGPTAVVAGDWMDQLISHFELEAKAGVALMDEYSALLPYIMSGSDLYGRPLLCLRIGDRSFESIGSSAVNAYLRDLREKYWTLLLSHDELTRQMTSKLQNEYMGNITELRDYDFSRYNITRVIREIAAQLTRGVEDSINALFDQLSAQHSWYPECSNNIHYYNGWATNKAHKVGMKVILPINGFYAHWDGKKALDQHHIAHTISDLDRALTYLDRGDVESRYDPYMVVRNAEAVGATVMYFTYFTATFYKKGTCHLKFHPEAAPLIDRLNIFAARGRNWLPPFYGRRRYEDMDAEAKSVIDEFQGREAYAQVMKNPDYYIVSPAALLPQIGPACTPEASPDDVSDMPVPSTTADGQVSMF